MVRDRVRPEPSFDPIDGYHVEAVPEGDSEYLRWVTPAVGAGRCRYTIGPGHKVCGAAPVATLFRGGKRQPWDYCAKHMYGRWVEDGRVMHWRRVKDEEV